MSIMTFLDFRAALIGNLLYAAATFLKKKKKSLMFQVFPLVV